MDKLKKVLIIIVIINATTIIFVYENFIFLAAFYLLFALFLNTLPLNLI